MLLAEQMRLVTDTYINNKLAEYKGLEDSTYNSLTARVHEEALKGKTFCSYDDLVRHLYDDNVKRRVFQNVLNKLKSDGFFVDSGTIAW